MSDLTSVRTTTVSSPLATVATVWIRRSLEGLWLLAVALVPLAFISRDSISSEAVIAYVEVPKITLLRTLVGLMAILWLIEWGIGGQLPSRLTLQRRDFRTAVQSRLAKVRDWLTDRPSRWLFLAVWFFLGTTLVSTALSGSFEVSLWGEVPGQDGYPAYTVIAYVLLFAVIATHLKTQAQLKRLLGAIVVMGFCVSGYAILQHYSLDFLNLTEITGGGTRQATSFMGNDIFAAAVIMMTIPISLLVGTLALWDVGPSGQTTERPLRRWLTGIALASLWGLVLAVQLLGITFTFARGPWAGSAIAIAGFFGLALLLLRWRFLIRAAPLMVFSLAIIVAVLLWQGSISTLAPSPLLGTLVLILGLGWMAGVLAPWRALSWTTLGLGLAAAVVLAAALGFMFSNRTVTGQSANQVSDSQAGDTTSSQVVERFKSTKVEVLSGFGGRGTHWRVSAELIRSRPWFSFDNLSLSWLRPLVGYGPDLFRYTYLLRSPPEGAQLFPLEPDHAHNFFIHQTVEQGFLGLISSLGLFAAIAFVGGYRILRQREVLGTFHLLVLIALLAVLVGRFFEMMVGVARVSDLTVLWVLVATFAALPRIAEANEPVGQSASFTPRRSQGRQNRARQRYIPGQGEYDWKLLWRLAIVACLIGGIGMLTWLKNVNYVLAATEVADGAGKFEQGEWQSALESLDRAIGLAPDVSVYYNHRAQVYLSYQTNEQAPQEQGCGSQDAVPYKVCLATEYFGNSLKSVQKRPFYYRSHMGLANSAFNLSQYDAAVRFYQESLSLVPKSWLIQNRLADAYLQASRPEEALQILEHSLGITRDSSESSEALFLRVLAYQSLGEPLMTIETGQRYLDLNSSSSAAQSVYGILGEVYLELGQPEKAAEAINKQAAVSRKLLAAAEAYNTNQAIKAARILFQQAMVDFEAGQSRVSVESLERSLEQEVTGLAKRHLQLLRAAVYAKAVQLELERVAGFPPGNLRLGLPDLLGVAKSLNGSNDAYLRFHQPELAPRFLYQLGLAFRDIGKSRNAAFQFHQSAPLYIRLDQPEQAALAFRQEILAYQTGAQLEKDAPRLLQSSQLYDKLEPPELAAQLHFQLGSVHLNFGDPQRAAQSFEQSATLFSRSDQPCLARDSLIQLGKAYSVLGELEKSAQALGESKRLTAC